MTLVGDVPFRNWGHLNDGAYGAAVSRWAVRRSQGLDLPWQHLYVKATVRNTAGRLMDAVNRDEYLQAFLALPLEQEAEASLSNLRKLVQPPATDFGTSG